MIPGDPQRNPCISPDYGDGGNRTRAPFPAALAARFWAKVDKSDECWLWLGYRDEWGYGRVRVARKVKPAHRAAYEFMVGPIPHGLVLDHLCFNTGCVNPAHLEPVTEAENQARRAATITHCKHGHPFDSANTYHRPRGGRDCRTCRTVWRRAYRERKADLPNDLTMAVQTEDLERIAANARAQKRQAA